MTWQRIDEDTYIDDTLVTCAEYQLFIDEMRERGKYHQPDHWSVYRFPDGQARKPVVGVRHSDAVVFCKWLSNREGKDWKFRLAYLNETNAYPIVKSVEEEMLGYWLMREGNFMWIDPAAGFQEIINLAIDHKDALELAKILNFLDPASARDHALELDRSLMNIFDRNLAFDRDQILANASDHAHAIYVLDSINRASSFNLNRIYVLTMRIYKNLELLQERIAGRSPAFEGIRLVKERIK